MFLYFILFIGYLYSLYLIFLDDVLNFNHTDGMCQNAYRVGKARYLMSFLINTSIMMAQLIISKSSLLDHYGLLVLRLMRFLLFYKRLIICLLDSCCLCLYVLQLLGLH